MTDAIKDAKEVVAHCEEMEGENRREAKIDAKFKAGEQWDEAWMGAEDRRRTQQPTITVNQLPQYVNQVTNDIKQNRPSLKARPVDDKADIELADIYGGIFRNAQDQGKADMARDIAVDQSVTQGLGWYRVVTDYTDAMSFDQELLYLGIDEPHNVYHNDFHMPDGSDLTDIVIVSSVAEAAYKAQYPDGDLVSWGETEATSEGGAILVAEYYCLKYRDDVLMRLEDGTIILESDAKNRINAGMTLAKPSGQERKTKIPYVYWRKLNGADELENRKIEIPHIPVFPVVGMCMRIDGKPVRFGLIRAARDPQRYYNWLKSAEVEYLQNAPKSPWVGDARAFAPYESYWANANTVNYSYLPTAGIDDQGNPIPPPQRNAPASIPSGLMQAELSATDDIKKSLGMYSAAIGARGNATSGKQELAQQREADVGTFHFSDNLAKSVLHEGRVLMSWVPKIYGKRQIARIIGIDDEPKTVRLTQALPQAVSKVRTSKGIEKVYNLGVGKYDVAVSVGPSYTTRRMETAESLAGLMSADPSMSQKAGDLYIKALDIPNAEEWVRRLRAFLPPQILQSEQDEDEQNPEAMRMALAQVQQAQQAIQQRAEALKEIEGKMNEREREIEKSTQAMAQERTQLGAEKQVLEARAKEIEMRISNAAMKAAEEVRRAAGDGSADALAEANKREEEMRLSMRLRDHMDAVQKAVAAGQPAPELGAVTDAEREMEGLRKAEDEAQERAMKAAEAMRDEQESQLLAAQTQTLMRHTEALAAQGNAAAAQGEVLQGIALLLAQVSEKLSSPRDDSAVVAEIRRQSAKTQTAVVKAVSDARTVKVRAVVDDEGNVTGGEITTASGKRHSVDLESE